VNDSVRTVLFDFDGTLVFHKPDSFDMISAFCAEIGQPLSEEAEWRGRRTRHAYFVDPSIREQLNRFAPGEFWQHFNRCLLEAVDIDGDLDLLAAEVTGRVAESDLTYYCPEEGYRTLTDLRDRGYGLGLITNRRNVDHFYELLDQMELRPLFDMTLASGEVGIHKPEPGIFHAALERVDASPGESLYVGDNYWADVIGAQRAGVTPVLLDPRRLFLEADCLVLDELDDLLAWLPSLGSRPPAR
jgi:HAD superfamily hydrolase (TIGR01549 family)